MKITLKMKSIAMIMVFCLAITSVPELAYALGDKDTRPGGQASKPPEAVTEENVIEEENTTSSTTFSLGGNKKMTVYHGGDVRFKDQNGKLTDYDPSLVKIKDGEKSRQKQNLKDYAYRNKQGDRTQYFPKNFTAKTPIRMENGSYAIDFKPASKTLDGALGSPGNVAIKKEKTATAYEEEEELPTKAQYIAKDAVLEYVSGDSGIKET